MERNLKKLKSNTIESIIKMAVDGNLNKSDLEFLIDNLFDTVHDAAFINGFDVAFPWAMVDTSNGFNEVFSAIYLFDGDTFNVDENTENVVIEKFEKEFENRYLDLKDGATKKNFVDSFYLWNRYTDEIIYYSGDIDELNKKVNRA